MSAADASHPGHPPDDASAVQFLRRTIIGLAILLIAAAFAFVAPQYPRGHLAHDGIVMLGNFLIFVCICGRTWCALYIGGRKKDDLVTIGPYSVTRNPLYLFSSLGAAGAGAEIGSVTTAIAVGLLTALLFHLVVAQEEKTLLRRHGDAFRDYCARVPRHLLRMSQWRDVEALDITLHNVRWTFLDACVFILAVPAAWAFEYLQYLGIVPVLLRLP